MWQTPAPTPEGTIDRHRRATARLITEDLGILLLLGVGAIALPAGPLRWAAIGLQGCWLHRLYTSGHEGVHRKLSSNRRLNDALTQLFLLPLGVPLPVYRKIHAFHHGQNRRDEATSALEIYVVRGEAGPIKRGLLYARWYASVLLGGFFLFDLVTVALFLALPLKTAARLHKAFRGWRQRDRALSLAALGASAGLHAGLAAALGVDAWARALGIPWLIFAWVYSLLVYIYHYDTTVGPEVRFHARTLRGNPVFSWWLINFNEHSTHHRDPSIPWYALPERFEPLPEAHQINQPPSTVGGAILNLMRGPRIVARAEVDLAQRAAP